MSPTASEVNSAALREASQSLEESLDVIRHCLNQLSLEQIWWRPTEAMNSIGNLILHLAGNLRQWIVCGIGGAADNRNRPAEFAQREPIPKEELLDRLEMTVADAQAALLSAAPETMLSTRRTQGFDLTGWGVLFHTVPHFKGHTQEIVSLTRQQLGDAYRFRWQPESVAQGAPAAP
jgi:hypothetical protein